VSCFRYCYKQYCIFCPSCLQLLPTILKSFDSLSLVDTKVAAVEKSVLEIQKAENQFISLSTKHDSLYKSVIELSNKVSSLSDQNQVLQQSVETIVSKSSKEVNSETDNSVASNFIIPPQNTPNATQAIVDELADRERRKHNIIVYNFPECTDHQANIENC